MDYKDAMRIRDAESLCRYSGVPYPHDGLPADAILPGQLRDALAGLQGSQHGLLLLEA